MGVVGFGLGLSELALNHCSKPSEPSVDTASTQQKHKSVIITEDKLLVIVQLNLWRFLFGTINQRVYPGRTFLLAVFSGS